MYEGVYFLVSGFHSENFQLVHSFTSIISRFGALPIGGYLLSPEFITDRNINIDIHLVVK